MLAFCSVETLGDIHTQLLARLLREADEIPNTQSHKFDGLCITTSEAVHCPCVYGRMATNDSSQSSLTSWLRTQHGDALDTATHHPFLQAAGAGTLPERELCTWLVQDKYYQFAYVNFIGRLIAKVDLTSYAFPNKEETNLEWKTFEVLIGALIAIKEEILFYNRTVESYGLEVEEADPDSVTRAYVKLFEESSTEGTPLLHGLTVLWATEYVSVDPRLCVSGSSKSSSCVLKTR